MEKEIEKGSWIYILIISLLYLIYGIIQFYNGLVSWWIPWLGGNIQPGFNILDTYIPNTFPDVFSGFILIIVGALLIRAIYLNYINDERSFGFLFVGWLLAMVLMVLNLLVIFADMLDAYYPLVWGESIEEGWTLAGDTWGIAPHLILGLLLLPFYPKMKWMIKELSSIRYKTSLSEKRGGR
ncbi:MAG: hypothetical protein GWP10_13095 [Nitrospiraceae bacterium]|nr:hypothetical protein [Nitrospiraceae bacterium]